MIYGVGLIIGSISLDLNNTPLASEIVHSKYSSGVSPTTKRVGKLSRIDKK